jgi:hypothetical protein
MFAPSTVSASLLSLITRIATLASVRLHAKLVDQASGRVFGFGLFRWHAPFLYSRKRLVLAQRSWAYRLVSFSRAVMPWR